MPSSIQFNIDDVRTLCHKMKRNKAPGWDAVVAEHLLYGPDILYTMYHI